MEDFGDLDLDDQYETACGGEGGAGAGPPLGIDTASTMTSSTDVSTTTLGGEAIDAKDLCPKCKERKAEYVARECIPTCWPCLDEAVTHRFKMILNKTRDRRDKVIPIGLALSGGISSWLMVHLISTAVGGGGTKPIKLFDTTIIHIDESSVLPTEKTDKSYQDEFKTIAQKYDMKLRIVPLEDVFACKEEGDSDDSLLSDDQDDANGGRARRRERLQQLFANVTTLTSKQDLVSALRVQLLIRVAQKLRLSKVLLGDNTTHQAIQVISSTCKGSGYAVPYEIALSSSVSLPTPTQDQPLLFVRPMKEFTAKELSIYALRKGLEPKYAYISSLDTMANSRKASLDVLVESFILNLQKDFPQTIHHILRTADKLSLPSDDGKSSGGASASHKKAAVSKPSAATSAICSLCLRPMPLEVIKEGIQAIEKAVSNSKKDEKSSCGDDTSSSCCTPTATATTTAATNSCTDCSCSTPTDQSSASTTATTKPSGGCCTTRREAAINDNLHRMVCLACRHVITDCKRKELLPATVTKEAKLLLSSAQLKEKISDYLLDEE